jgi:phage N-6-adenine-methyltransferase
MNKVTQNLMFSSEKQDWATPQQFFDEVNKKYGPFDLDVCATHDNAKCSTYYTLENFDDGLKNNWSQYKRCWMNPPYGRGIGEWVRKAYSESLNGCLVVCLLPARTDTKWFHEYCMKGKIEFIKGRLKFGNSKNSAPFPSMIVIFFPAK